MLGSILASFAMMAIVTNMIDYYLTNVTSVVGYYLSFMPDFVDTTLTLVFYLFFFLLFFFLLMRGTVRYLRILSEGLMKIAQGNMETRVPAKRQDELGAIAQNINFMAEQLQDTMARERRTEMSKMELITHVSHDLRTPLTSIIGYLNLLQTDRYEDMAAHRRYIDNASKKTQQLKKLIDDLFEYTRLTGGDVKLDLRKVDVGGLLAQVGNEFEPIAQESGLKVTMNREERAYWCRIDPERFVRALDNLLVNALKFSLRPGNIAISLEEKGTNVFLAVENWGNPIAKEQEQLLFERFYKAEPSRTDPLMPAGAGLGLSIARNIVLLHGGKLDLTHENGHFTFTIELPRCDADEAASGSAAAGHTSSL